MNTRDITSRFRDAAQKVKAGKLVKDDHFSLFEAVGALEIGDPKMDSGCLQPGESLDDDFDMLRNFMPGQLIWLMDQLLNREVAWLMGYPLSQTLFTSLHVDRLLWPEPKILEDADFVRGHNRAPLTLSHQVLRAYCLLLLKACDIVLDMVTSQHYYEEEDFTTQLFNRELLHRFAGQEVSAVGLSAIQALEQSSLPQEAKQALRIRLEFRMQVLQTLMHHIDGESPPDSYYGVLRECLARQKESQQQSIAVEGAFSTKLQRRLASTVPPRPMVTVSMEEAWTFWSQMLIDCRDVFSVHVSQHSQDSLIAYQLFAYRAPQPSTYPRALLQSFLTMNGGLIGGRTDSLHFLEEDVQSLTLPASQLLSLSTNAYGRLYNSNQTVAECMQSFVDKFEHTFTNLYRALCLNECRIRRTFCHALLEWDSKQGEVEELDATIHAELRDQPLIYPSTGQSTFAYPLSSWVYHHKLTVLRLTIQMGFEQSIYAPHELSGMYWYLSHICGLHLSHLERISHFVTDRDSILKSTNTHSSIQEKGKQECQQALDRLFRQYAWIKATQLLANTLHSIFAVLQRIEVFSPPSPLYSSDDLRLEIRMKPFMNLSIPECLSFDEFSRQSQMQHFSTENILQQATETGVAAKRAWEEILKTSWHSFPLPRDIEDGPSQDNSRVLREEWTSDVKNCLKASIAANLCVLTLQKMIDNDQWKVLAKTNAKVVDPDRPGRWHRCWAVPSLPHL